MYISLGLFLCCYSVSGINFDTNKMIEVELNDSDIVHRSYFGYSLLLQKGPNPMVIVGSPKQSNITGGAVFGCNIFYLGGHGCTKYNISVSNVKTFNGNFLGTALVGGEDVGDPFIVSAPRKVFPKGFLNNVGYWLKGSCLYQKNSSLINEPIFNELQPLIRLAETGTRTDGVNFYYYGFGQAGIDIYYNKELSMAYLGAVGISNWQGSVVVQSLTDISKYSVLQQGPIELHQHEYLGYKIDYGRFDKKDCIIAGAPRGNNLRGNVVLFHKNSVYQIIQGEELGSYFGSAILAKDVDNNQSDDLFVGAPTASGSSFDEGYVYYYKNVTRLISIKLVGGRKRGARFGTSIVSLGDIDLDSFNDIAISAPFEDGGIGAVYIYKGGVNGINPTYSQRLSPSKFPRNNANIRGFGMGLSKGADVDSNGYNDLAIGAYQTGRVFVVTTKPIIDFKTTLESNVSSITNNSHISIKYCVQFTPRATTAKLKLINVSFQLTLSLDYRFEGKESYLDNITSLPQINTCRNVNVSVQQTPLNLLPVKYSLSTQVISEVFAQGTNKIEKAIPYAHGCGDDNICQTQILLNVKTNSDFIILGRNKTVNVYVSAENVGEPGYQCQLYIDIPKEIEIKLGNKCTYENSSYICPFTNKLDTDSEKEVMVPFDILSNDITLKKIIIDFELKCLGENNFLTNEYLILKVLLQNSAYIVSSSNPEIIEVSEDDSSNEMELDIIHTFTVGNNGPSPLKTDIYFLIPIIKIGNQDLFKFIEVKNGMNGHQVQCSPTNEIRKNLPNNLTSIVKTPINRTTVIDCLQDANCFEMFCEGDILYNSFHTSKYRLKFKSKRSLLVQYFEEKDKLKTILAYVSSAIISNKAQKFDGHLSTLIVFSHTEIIPLWVYVVGAVVGAFLLCLLIVLLFKCKFFERQYRDKLHTEKLISSNYEDQDPPSPGPLEKLQEEEEGTKFELEVSSM